MDSSSVLSDEDYDVISNPGQRSLECSIAWDATIAGASPTSSTSPGAHTPPRELPPTDAARVALSTVSLSPADIQTHVRDAVEGSAGARYPSAERTVRVYVDGVFDALDAT